jgi:hypothetical protein
MSVGNQTSSGNINSALTTLALQLRESSNVILQQQAYLNKLGLSGLQAIGYTSGDAQGALDTINHMATIAGCYKGTVQQGGSGGTGAILFNFEDYLTPLWAGQ